MGIAQALLNRPKLLICDEPTSALDPVGRKEILDILLTVRQQTTVLVTVSSKNGVSNSIKITVKNNSSKVESNNIVVTRDNDDKSKFQNDAGLNEENGGIWDTIVGLLVITVGTVGMCMFFKKKLQKNK